jgi:Putative Actinobacterial Holin-X, holin superfamily III
MAYSNDRSIPAIFTDIVHQLGRLFRSEAALARAEMSEKVAQVGAGLGLIIGGAVLLIPALVVLLLAAVTALEEAGFAAPMSALIVGGGVLLLGMILLMVGISRLRAKHLVPERTVAQLKRDAAVATQMRNDHAPIDRAA